jgi:cyclase
MIKKRLVACLVVKEGIVVQSIGFRKYLPVGKVTIAAEFLNSWGIDEIVLLDIDATPKKKGPNFNLVNLVSSCVFVPLSVGGGITSVEQMRKLVQMGADKIIINKVVFNNLKIIKKATEVLGSQCVVISIDVKVNKKGNYEVYSDSGRNPTGIHPLELAKQVERLGAGEILINSVDRDGSQQGYDVDLIKMVSASVSIPVIAIGSAGHPHHFWSGLVEGEASAVAAANFFHFTEHSPLVVKSYLKQQGVNVRIDTSATYQRTKLEDNGRVAKRSAQFLEKLQLRSIRDEKR